MTTDRDFRFLCRQCLADPGDGQDEMTGIRGIQRPIILGIKMIGIRGTLQDKTAGIRGLLLRNRTIVQENM